VGRTVTDTEIRSSAAISVGCPRGRRAWQRRRGALATGTLLLTLGWVASANAAAHHAPAPAFPRLKPAPLAVVAFSDKLEAGSRAEVAVRMSHPSRCSLRLSGPGGSVDGPYTKGFRHEYGSWHWMVPGNVRGGAWTATVRCGMGRSSNTWSSRVLVAMTAANNGSLVSRGSLRISSTRTPPGPSGVSSGGKGGGGYPDAGALCKWTGRPTGYCAEYEWGYRQASGRWQVISGRGFNYRNCTDFVAWFLGVGWSSFRFPAGRGNASDWAAYAGNAGLKVVHSPTVGDVAWWGRERAHGFGHVAIVTAVNSNGTVTIAEYNGDGEGDYDLRPNVVADAYLHRPAPPPPTPAQQYAGHIVQWSGDHNGQKAAWLVAPDGKRFWIPTIAIYWCLKEQGRPGPDVLPATVLEQLPDSGQSATCAGGRGGSEEPLPKVEPKTTPEEAPPPPPPPTYAETPGGITHTWTNYSNAGGTEGPSIPSNQTVQIACKVTGFRVADGNTWWYRIASSPWNNAYYASADAFYNNGQTSGSLIGTPFVDPAVPNC
jgi:surface antigen